MIESLEIDEALEVVYGSDGFVHCEDLDKHRWYTVQLIVFEREGELYGFYHLDPATEMQEGQDRFYSDPVKVFPVEAKEIITTVYREKHD